MKKLTALLLTVACAGSVWADAASHKATAKELVEVMAPKASFMESFSAVFDAQMASLQQMGITQDKIARIKAASVQFAQTIADDPDLWSQMIALYQEAYSESEMKELLAFYKTPIGQKTLKMMPDLIQKGALVGQQVAQKHQADFQAKVQAILTEK